VSNAGQLGDVGETVVCAGAACHGYLSFRDRDPEAAYFIWHLFGMPLHLRLKTREHYRTLLDAHLLREVRRWFPRRGDPAAPAARTGRTSLEMRWPEGDSLLFPAAHGGHLASATLYRQFDKARDVASRPDLRFHQGNDVRRRRSTTRQRHVR
jgi:hypothetical protein